MSLLWDTVGLIKQLSFLLMYYHKEQKIRGRHLDRFGRFLNDCFPSHPLFLLETNAELFTGHAIKFSGLAYGSSSHLSCALKLFLLFPSLTRPLSLLSCTIYYLLSLCLPVPGLLISLYLLMPEKMLLLCRMVLRGADIIASTRYLACCKPMNTSISLLLFCILFYGFLFYLFSIGCFPCLTSRWVIFWG